MEQAQSVVLSDWRRFFFLVGGTDIEPSAAVPAHSAACSISAAVGRSARISSTLRSSTSPTRRNQSSRVAMADFELVLASADIIAFSLFFRRAEAVASEAVAAKIQ
jgi:hypothetical protein